MLYWLLMMIIMVIVSNNDKLQIVSAGCVKRLIQTMIWLTVSEFYQAIWPILIRRLNPTLAPTQQVAHHHHHPAIQHLSQHNQYLYNQMELVRRMAISSQQAAH